MRLSDRLSQVNGGTPRANPTEHRVLPLPAPPEEPATDPLVELKQRAEQSLFSRLGARLYDASLSEEQLHTFVRQELSKVIAEERAPLSDTERDNLVSAISENVLGYGPVQPFLDDPSVTEVMVNAEKRIYIERAGKLERTSARFFSDDHLRRVIERIVSQVGRRIDESSPMVDARLPDGSRVNAIIPPLSVDGPTLTIRKFAADPYQTDDLVGFGTMTPEIAELLAACVQGRLNILVSGGTGTGKTTMLNVISSFVPPGERIVTIEDSVELQLHQDHVVRLEARPPNIEGKGAVGIRDLVRNALRMRPDRIIVGEVRGGEALDMLQAMNTGHDGSLTTLHANTPRDAIARLETMVLMAGMDLPMRAIREQISSAIDVMVHVTRLRDGSRRITHVTEVHGMEGDVVTLQDIFTFDYSAGIDESGRYRGGQRPTGIRPAFTEQLSHYGIQLPVRLFGQPDNAAVIEALRPGRRPLP
ncbi:MAG TPA: CpaF family protein [Egibacteraceae bacterium]|jgi:pilus assembly protein CpaF|nr:CpaF family protein [Egibacteraceae bacterium]